MWLRFRETVVSPDLLEPLAPLDPLVHLDQLDLLERMVTVESL